MLDLMDSCGFAQNRPAQNEGRVRMCGLNRLSQSLDRRRERTIGSAELISTYPPEWTNRCLKHHCERFDPVSDVAQMRLDLPNGL
jgi:hypothetical protein